MTRKAAEKVYQQSGLGPENVDVIELHDCFSTNELITYEGLGLCEPGKGGELIDSGAVTYGGKWVVNPVGRSDLEGPSARRHGPRAVRGAQLAAAREGGQAPGQGRQGRPAAQPGSRRRGGRDHVPQARESLSDPQTRRSLTLRAPCR